MAEIDLFFITLRKINLYFHYPPIEGEEIDNVLLRDIQLNHFTLLQENIGVYMPIEMLRVA